MSYVPTVMEPLAVVSEIERLQRSWMNRYTVEAHEVSGLYVWVVFYLDNAGELRRVDGQRCSFNTERTTVAVARNASCARIPLDRVVEVHIKPTA